MGTPADSVVSAKSYKVLDESNTLGSVAIAGDSPVDEVKHLLEVSRVSRATCNPG